LAVVRLMTNFPRLMAGLGVTLTFGARSRPFRYTSDRYQIGAARRRSKGAQQRNRKVVDPTIVLIPDILSKIRPRNCPNQPYLRCITDSGPAPGVGG
jgi:hypothetical protein